MTTSMYKGTASRTATVETSARLVYGWLMQSLNVGDRHADDVTLAEHCQEAELLLQMPQWCKL